MTTHPPPSGKHGNDDGGNQHRETVNIVLTVTRCTLEPSESTSSLGRDSLSSTNTPQSSGTRVESTDSLNSIGSGGSDRDRDTLIPSVETTKRMSHHSSVYILYLQLLPNYLPPMPLRTIR